MSGRDTPDDSPSPPEDRAVTVEDLRSRAAGTDFEDPYEAVAVDELPAWWAAAIEEFAQRDLRTYQPSRLSDGAVLETTTATLGARYGVEVRFRGENVTYGDDWEVVVDGTAVTQVSHRRSPAGYSVFGLDAPTLEHLVEEYVTQRS